MVFPGTSSIHSKTFALALGWEVGEEPTNGWIMICGVSPLSTKKVKEWRAKGIKVIGYWIGSDSWCALSQEDYRSQIPELDLHVCVHERIRDELKAWDVQAKVLYPTVRGFKIVTPQEKRIGVYMPDVGDLYMYSECIQIAHENPDLEFMFYGKEEYPTLPRNVKTIGRVTPEETPQMSVMLRLCRHDGFPVGGIEAKMSGLHVIENYPYKGFLYAKTLEEVNEFLKDDEMHKGDQGPWPSWYRENLCPQKFKENLCALL